MKTYDEHDKDERIRELEALVLQALDCLEKHQPILYSKAWQILNKGKEKWDGIKI